MRVSIITVTYNCRETVSDALAAVAVQRDVDVEHLVIDGASTDGTLAVLQAYRGGLTALISEPDGGIYEALNKGLKQATGEVVGLLHADDVYADATVLSRVADTFADPSVTAVYGDLEYVARANSGRVIRYWRAGEFSPDRLRRGWMPPHPTLFLRRSLYDQFGLFDTRYRIAADYDLMLRMLTQLPGRMVYLPQVLVKMRIGGASNSSVRQVLRKSWEDYRALRSNRVGGVGALLWKNLSKLPQFVRRS